MFTQLFRPKWEHSDPRVRRRAFESGAVPAEAVERMRHALALAEYRLVSLYGRRLEDSASQVIDLAAARNRVA